MGLDAVGIVCHDVEASLAFYRSVGVEFGAYDPDVGHYEAALGGGLRLMVDSEEVMASFIDGYEPPSGDSRITLAVSCESPTQVDALYEALTRAGHGSVVEPFDAFWGHGMRRSRTRTATTSTCTPRSRPRTEAPGRRHLRSDGRTDASEALAAFCVTPTRYGVSMNNWNPDVGVTGVGEAAVPGLTRELQQQMRRMGDDEIASGIIEIRRATGGSVGETQHTCRRVRQAGDRRTRPRADDQAVAAAQLQSDGD